MLNVQTVMRCISSQKSWCILPMPIQNLLYAVSRARFSYLPFLNHLSSYISFSPAHPLALENLEMAYASTMLHLLSLQWLLMSTRPYSMVVGLTHSGYMVHCITKWGHCILQRVGSHPMHSSTSMMSKPLLLPATPVIQISIVVSWVNFRTC